jgi:glycosyltransferase involved in cell wall biosynthesis
MPTSVIIPAYNAEAYLGEAIESVQAQTCSDWELIVVDDGSTDGTHALACRYARSDSRIRVVRQQNAGQPAARNFGFTFAEKEAQYLSFLDADDAWEPGALERLIGALEEQPNRRAAHGLSRFIDSRGQSWRPGEAESYTRQRQAILGQKLVAWPPDRPTTFANMAYRNYIWTPGQALLRRSAFEAAGPFDGEIRGCEDWDMWLRICRQGDIAFLDQVVLRYRRHETNTSKRDALMRTSELVMRRKLLASAQLSAAQRRTVLSGYRCFERHKCKQRLRLAQESVEKRQFVLGAKYLRRALLFYLKSLPFMPV